MYWSGVDYLWIIVKFLSAVWTLILTAPIHIHSPLVSKWCNDTFLQIWWTHHFLNDLNVIKLPIIVLVNYSFKQISMLSMFKSNIKQCRNSNFFLQLSFPQIIHKRFDFCRAVGWHTHLSALISFSSFIMMSAVSLLYITMRDERPCGVQFDLEDIWKQFQGQRLSQLRIQN